MRDLKSYSYQPFAFLMRILPGIPFTPSVYQPVPSQVDPLAAMPAASAMPLCVLRGRRTNSALISLGRLTT